MPDSSSIPATAVADELLRLTTKVLATLDQDEEAFEAEQTAKRDALRQLVERDRDAVTRATERLNDLYRAARAVADNKGRRDVLESILRMNVPLDPTRTFDEVDTELRQELKLARGITGAMRVPDIGRLLNQAAVQVDHLEDRADELEARLRDADSESDESSPGRQRFAEALANLRRDLDAFDAALPLPARPWDDEGWNTWSPPTEASAVLRLGRFTDARLGESAVPALLEVPTDAGFVIEPARKREQAIDAARAFALRAMAAFPPGRARFTFVDPKGLGESVAPFLHLAGREGAVIEGVLTGERDIEAHLERLVNGLDGSRHGDECHLLFVFDHPIGLSARAIGLVRTLTEAGSRGGVFTVVVKDSRTGAHPREARALPALRTIRATKDGFETEAADARRPIRLDDPPTPELFERISGAVVDPGPVEAVPDAAPLDLRDEDTWWEADATDALDVVLDAGGQGLTVVFDPTTSAAVVAGKDDERLTEALHDAVEGMATRYSPAELQLHLVGLGPRREFESYAQRGLPHARLVGFHADRELALSALESAGAEVSRRLVLFQAAGVLRDGYAAYRRDTGHALARIVVVIDDVGELFGREDALRRELDDQLARIALDGAATGVHVLMVDRSGRTAPTVLAQLPASARELVVVPDGDGTAPDAAARAGTLRALRVRAEHEGPVRSPTVVDGSARASFEHAPLDLLGPAGNGGGRTPRLWFGEPVGLGTPVEVTLRPEAGANVLMVMADPVLGQGMVLSAITAAALATGPTTQLHVVDLMPLEDGLAAAATALSGVAEVAVSRRRDLAAGVEAVRNQVVNRLARRGDATPWVFVLNGVDRRREQLEGDASLEVVRRHLPQIVHEGPKVGIHTVLWGTDRSVEGLIGADAWRAFGVRVVGPVDETSSLALIDSPIAARLAPNRAVLYDEAGVRVTRFRPYGLARAEWIASQVSRRLPAGHQPADR